MSIGFRAFLDVERPDPALIEAYRGIPSSNIGDCVKNRMRAGSYTRQEHREDFTGLFLRQGGEFISHRDPNGGRAVPPQKKKARPEECASSEKSR